MLARIVTSMRILIWKTVFLMLETCGQTSNTYGKIACATKMFWNLFGNVFPSWEANFVYTTGKHWETGEQGNIDTHDMGNMFSYQCFILSREQRQSCQSCF